MEAVSIHSPTQHSTNKVLFHITVVGLDTIKLNQQKNLTQFDSPESPSYRPQVKSQNKGDSQDLRLAKYANTLLNDNYIDEKSKLTKQLPDKAPKRWNQSVPRASYLLKLVDTNDISKR